MKMVYGTYPLALNCAEYDILLQTLRNKVISEHGNRMGGVPLVTLQEYQDKGAIGYSLIGSDDKQSIIGVAYKAEDLSRLWFVPTTEAHEHSMFIDGYPDLVEKLDLIFEKSTGHLISPANNNKIILEKF